MEVHLRYVEERHRRALGWFFDRAGTIQEWPGKLDGEVLLVTKAKGIYKPKWTDYALSVRQTLYSPYADEEPVLRDDGTWQYRYHQEEDSSAEDPLTLYTNKGLLACMRDQVPVGVMRQVESRPVVRYNVLGVAVVADLQDRQFVLEGFSPDGSLHGSVQAGGWQEEMGSRVLQQVDGFQPNSEEDARKRILASIVQRRGQQKFRDNLLAAYGGRCAISDCTVGAALEAAHIVPYAGPWTNHPQNGLLLRADLHTLFDLGLVAVDGRSMSVVVAERLIGTMYETLQGAKLHLPHDEARQPSRAALDRHRRTSRV